MKYFLKFVVLALELFVDLSYGQIVASGQCPAGVEVQHDFDVKAYLGTWYEYAKYPVQFEQNGACITAQYSLKDDGNVAVNNTLTDATTGRSEEILGTASVVSNAKLLVTFPVTPAINVSSNYWVLGTDYCEYSVVYSCQPSSDTQYSTFVWILTRQRLPKKDVVEAALSVLKINSISPIPLSMTNQVGCN